MRVEFQGKGSAENVANCLAPAFAETPASLQLSFADEPFFFPSGAAWITTLLMELQRRGVEIEIDGSKAPDTVGYLARMNFFEHLGLEPPETGERLPAAGRFLPMLAYSDSDQQYEVVNSIIDLLLMHFDDARAMAPAVEWALNEISDNVVNHAEIEVPAIVFAQFYPKKSSLSVAICDAGRGLRESLVEAHEVPDDEAALELAMQRGVTRGPGQGNGIAGTRQIMNVNGGGFALWSGSKFHYEDGERDYVKDIEHLPGTGVSMRFKTDRPIDLRKTFIESVAFSYIDVMAQNMDEGEHLMIATQCSSFGNRPAARRVRRKITAILPDMEERLALDFAGVETVASSFIDELLGKLIEELGYDEYKRKIQVVNMNESVTRRANVTIEQRMREGLDEDSFSRLFGDLRPAPELELEGWLALHPEELEREPLEVVEEYAANWDIDLTDEVREAMLQAFRDAEAGELGEA